MTSPRSLCPDDEQVAALLATELGAMERRAIELHLDDCTRCRALVASVARTLPRTEPAGPARIGRYRLGERIGRGGMGEVYRAEPIDPPGPAIALKLLPQIDPAALLRFKQEFRSVADLSHRNLVALYELGSDRDEWYIAMELVDGRDFVSAVCGDHDRVRAALRELADGLSALHAAGHVHRDIKPANVMIEPGGRVVILDFGLIAALSYTGQAAGTPAYMAPEVLAGDPPDVAADFYAVGVMLHEVLAGRRAEMTVASIPGPPDLARLCSALLDRDPAKRAGAAELVAVSGASVGARSESAPSHFVGRTSELATLAALFDDVLRGDARVVAIAGPSGIGKTTLVRRFLDERSRDAFVLCGRCYDRETVAHKALDPLVDELARLLEALPPHELAALRPADAADLARMFPVLRGCFPDDTPEPVRDLHLAHRRAARALRGLLAALASQRPLILWIDDLQWGDADSAPLLAELFAPPAPAILLVATHRPGAVPSLGELVRETVALAPLADDDATTLATRLVRSGDRELAGRIARESGGIPLFIAELARDEVAPTTSLDHAIRQRFVTLPEIARTLLAAIVVAGRPIDHRIVTRVADANQAPLARLRADRWVEVRGDEVETVHDRVRVAVRGALADSEVAAWHGRLAIALELAGADPELLVEHWRGAGEQTRAQTQAIRAAERAMRALSFNRAARLYELASSLAPLDPARTVGLAASRAGALAAAGRGVDAARAYELARDHSTGDAAAEYARLGAEELVRSGHVDAGLEALDGVLGTMGVRLRASPRGAARSLAVRRLQLRLELARPARRRVAAQPAVLRRIDTCWAVACALGTVDTVRAADLHSRTLIDALRAGEPVRLGRSLAAEAAFAAAAGPRARPRVDRLLSRARAVVGGDPDPLVAGTLAGATGMAAFLTGRWAEALTAFDATDAVLARCAGGAWERNTSRLYALIALTYLGRIRELRRRVAITLADADDRGDLYASASVRTASSNFAWLAAGDADGARRLAEEGARGWSRRGFHLQHCWSLLSRARADLYAGDGERAFAQLAASWPALEASLLFRIQVVACEALDLRARAALASARGGVRRARLEQATRDANRLAHQSAPHAHALAAVVRASLAGGVGDLVGARAHLATATAIFDAQDMPLHARAADRARGVLDDDTTRVASADEWMRGEDIVDPVAIAELLVPSWSENRR